MDTIKFMEADNVHQVFHFGSKARMSLYEANKMVDLLLTITRDCKNQVMALNSQKECYTGFPDKVKECESKIQKQIDRWCAKIHRLGLDPDSLWKVKIPAKNGDHYEWEFPADQVK